MIKKYQINSNNQTINLKNFSPADTNKLLNKDIKKEYSQLQKKFSDLQEVLYAAKKYSLLIILQGMDCSGKDGTVKKALSSVNPNGFYVESFKTPTPVEIGHGYLWRVHKETPVKGNIVVFNRSYYEDVLITRVHKTIDDNTTFRRFDEINAFEKYLVANDTLVLKFFLNISKDFQQKKLMSRLENPKKRWKFSDTDLKERKFWDNYQECYADLLSNCSTKEAPWHVIPSNHRWFRDYVILKTIVASLEDLKLEYPTIENGVHDLIEELKHKS